MSKYPFKWKAGGGTRCLQPAPEKHGQGGGKPGMLLKTGKLETESGSHIPEPLVHLQGTCGMKLVLYYRGRDNGPGGYGVPNICPH